MNETVGRAPHLRVRLAGTAPGLGAVRMCFPSDAFPFSFEDGRFVTRARDTDEFPVEARTTSARK